MTRRPWRHALLPGVLAVIAATGLWRVFVPSDLAAGLGAGTAAGVACGWLLAARLAPARGVAANVERAAMAAAAFASGLAVVTGDVAAITTVADQIATLLSIGLPADGLAELFVVPYVCTALTVAAAVASALSARLIPAVVAASLGLVVSSLFAAPVGVPWPVPVAFCVVLAVWLLVTSRFDYSELEPLVGTSTAIRRNQHWWRPAVTAAPAAALALVALALPLPTAFDVRQFVSPAVIDVVDENPLALAARLLHDPPPSAAGIDVTVTVVGPSPGRMRLAVLDDYDPEGWSQLAEFQVTGTHLARPPVEVAPRTGTRATVGLRDGPGSTGFAALPTPGTPREVADATGLLFSPDAGLLLATGGEVPDVWLVTLVDRSHDPTRRVGAPPGLAPAWSACPDSPILADAAAFITAGLTDPRDRLRAIESFLKLGRIYDTGSAGGQTIASVERFLGQNYAKGNLEVFVTTFALLARCAGVPVRVVVGYPPPVADATTVYAADAVGAWVETPIAGVGWWAVDPLPNEAEQQRQAELAAAATPPDPIEPSVPEEEPVADVRIADLDGPVDWRVPVIGVVIAIVALGAAAALWSALVRRRTLTRRSRVADPALATLFAWTTVLERFSDVARTLAPHLTASEMARVTAGRVPVPVTTMMGELASLVDRARYDGARSSPADAGLAWALTDEILRRMPSGRAGRLVPLRHPRRALRRMALTRGQPRRRDRWRGVVPPSAAVLETTPVPEIPGYAIEARIGVGATSAVYRAHHRTTGEAAAIKVFTIDAAVGSDVDHQRFVWEARVAEMVSGRPNLPVVLGSGFATNGQPYLVTKLYTNGTLASRVRIGGPLGADEVAAAGRELALALAVLHENGVLHGDVKPENVFIADDGSMVLGDLGGAWVPSGRRRTASLTPAYAAPEVWLGYTATTASDLYSLGLTLLFAATGTPPHPGAPPGADEIVAAFGADTALRLLEIDPRRRFRSAAAVAAYFGADLADRSPGGKDGPVRLPPPSWTIRS